VRYALKPSVCPDLPQSVVIYPEMMSQFMPDDAMDSCAYLFQCATAHQDGLAVDADLIRQDETILVSALRLRDAVIEAQELCWVAYPGLPDGFLVRPILDHYLDVVQFLLEVLRQRVEGLCN